VAWQARRKAENRSPMRNEFRLGKIRHFPTRRPP
jgi:hypothetical protein